jgi:hypothetical protein
MRPSAAWETVVIDQLREDDIERLFADWGVPVTLRRVTQTASPSTGEVDEATADFLVTSVVTPLRSDPTPKTRLQHQTFTLRFLLRCADLPAGLALSTSRVVHGGNEFSVVGTETSADGLTVSILGQRM